MNTWEQGTWGYRDGGTGMGDMVTGAGGHRDTVEKGQGTQGHSGVGVAGQGGEAVWEQGTRTHGGLGLRGMRMGAMGMRGMGMGGPGKGTWWHGAGGHSDIGLG